MMHTWALVCSLTINPTQCVFDTADRWFEVAPEPVNIQVAIVRLGIFDNKSQFIKIFKYEGSLGTDTFIYYPCDTVPSDIDNAINELREDLRLHLRKEVSKGACLRSVRVPSLPSAPHPLGVGIPGLSWRFPNNDIGRGFLRPGSLTEQQARVVAARFVRGFGFGPNGGEVIPVPDSPAASKSLEEVASHLWLSLLVVRGDTGYCGVIREPTWIFMWNTEESASWFGGYPVMINARTGKVLDCRS